MVIKLVCMLVVELEGIAFSPGSAASRTVEVKVLNQPNRIRLFISPVRQLNKRIWRNDCLFSRLVTVGTQETRVGLYAPSFRECPLHTSVNIMMKFFDHTNKI